MLSYVYPFAVQDGLDLIERVLIAAHMEQSIAFRNKAQQIIFLKQLHAFFRRQVPFALCFAKHPALHIGNSDLLLAHGMHPL